MTAEKLDSLIKLKKSDASASRAAFANLTAHIPNYPDQLFSGKGIVMIAGGKYSGYAATSLNSLRLAGTTLPVEMWMPDRSDDSRGWCAELPSQGARCRFFTDHIPPSLFYIFTGRISSGYQYKGLAMVLSSFEEILLLDADNHALRNLDTIFDAPTYQEKRVILWPDYWLHSGSPWLPYIVGLSDEKSTMLMGEPTVESGQVLWDKRRRWRVRPFYT